MLVSVYLTRLYLFPAVPDPVISLDEFTLGKDTAVMLLFAAIMTASSLSTLRSASSETRVCKEGGRPGLLVLLELFVGVLTGFADVGGGFIVLPVLLYSAHLPVRVAVGTSLMIITVNALAGFAGELGAVSEVDTRFLAVAISLALIGILIGTRASSIVDGRQLK